MALAPLGAGDLRERVTFDSRVVASDSYGNERTESFSEQFTVAAAIRPRLGGEQVLAGRLAGTNLVNVIVRRSGDTDEITTTWRGRNARSGEVYNIRSKVDPYQNTPQHGRFWELLCEVGLPQ